MTVSSFRSICRKPATQFEKREFSEPGRIVKGSLFCVFCLIFLCLTMFPSAAASQSNGVAVIGPNPNSTPYGCNTNPVGTLPNGIPQAISDAITLSGNVTQSVVDASNCTTLTITSQIYVGVADQNQLVKERIKFILPANGTWTANFSDTTKNAFIWGNGAMIYGGTGSGEGQPFTITTASGTALKAVCGNDLTYGTYFHAEGFSCSAGNGSTVTDAVISIGDDADESYLGHVTAGVGGGVSVPRALWIWGACCSATFEDINAEAFNNANTIPCNFGFPPGGTVLTNYGIHVSKLSCVHPGKGQPAVLIFQSGFGGLNQGIGNSFRDIYMEQSTTGQSGGQDNTTPWVGVRQYGGAYAAADLLEGFRASVDTTGSTRCVLDLGSGIRVNVSNLSLSNTSTCGIDDGTGPNNVFIYGAPNSVIAGYSMTPLILGGKTVNTLPPANQSTGAMFRVSDSTPINAEGQACAGGSTNTALAFSNGSAWKCF